MVTIYTDRTIYVTVFRKDTRIDQYFNFQSNHPLHRKYWLAKTLFHMADILVSKPDDILSKEKHLRHTLNQCGYKNSIIDLAISHSKRHDTKTVTSIHKCKCFVTFPYFGEHSEKHDSNFTLYLFAACSSLQIKELSSSSQRQTTTKPSM